MKPTERKTIKKLVGLAQGVLRDIQKKRNPRMAIPLRTLANVKFNEKKSIIELGDDKQERLFFNVSMAKKFMQTFLVAAACRDLLNEGKTTSIRDLFYMTKHTIGDSDENTFEEQEESDPIIEDLEVTVDALREELNLFANRKGMMVGPLTIVDSGDAIDLRRMGSGGWGIPSIVEEDVIRFRKCEAKYVLFVEKGAVWSRLNEDKFWKKHRCLLLTSEGMPPRGVRRLLHRIDKELKLPIYVLVDNDPWGFYIYSVIKQGSINLAYESMRMAIPKVKFLGLSSYDADRYKLPKNVTIRLNEKDKQRAKQLLDYPWFKKKTWENEIRKMMQAEVKLELEALSSRGISFISEEYLPRKMRTREWLD